MNILISFDDNYLLNAMNLIYSIKKYNCDISLNIYVIHDNNLSKKSIKELEEYVNKFNLIKINFLYFESEVIFPKYIDYISINTYYRLFAPFYLPNDVDRILYIDCDVICNGSLLELYNMEFNDNLLIGCENLLLKNLQIWRERNRIRLSLPNDYIYINAGVLLFNVKEYKNEISKDDIILFINNNYRLLIFQDQDVINKMFYDRIKHADIRYNYQINAVNQEDMIYNLILIHYSEKLKPWNLDYYEPEKAIYYYKIIKEQNNCDCLKQLINTHYQNKASILYKEIIEDDI